MGGVSGTISFPSPAYELTFFSCVCKITRSVRFVCNQASAQADTIIWDSRLNPF